MQKATFVKLIMELQPHGGVFNNDVKHIRTVLLKSKHSKGLSDTENILEYMLDNFELDLECEDSDIKLNCYGWFNRWLNMITNANKDVPNIGFDTTDILIAILAFTGTGISWIIRGSQKHSQFSEFYIGTGIINIFIFILFAASLYFSWVLAVQITLGILFSLFAIFTALIAISNLFHHRKDRRERAKFSWQTTQDCIGNMRRYLEKVKLKSEQDKSDKQNKSNDKIKDEADNQNNNFPDSEKIIDKNDEIK